MPIKNKLREIRLKEYMIDSKTEFANILNVPVQTYTKWENGKSTPTLLMALQVAYKLNKDIKDIWYLEE